MINRIRNAVNFITNNQVQGNVTPTEFNIALNNSILALYDDYFAELTKLKIGETKGFVANGLGDMVSNLNERIQYYLTHKMITLERGGFALPADCRFVDAVSILPANRRVEFASSATEFELAQALKHTKASEKYPLGLKMGKSIKIYPMIPAKITHVNIFYLRTPTAPNWTYRMIPGNTVELFDPSNPLFQDVDMHVSEENRLILDVLRQFGINLKDPEVMQAAQVYAQQDAQKNNIV